MRREAAPGRSFLPTWLLVLVMAGSLGVAIWTVARDQITDLVSNLL